MGGIIEVIVALVIVLMVRFEYMKDPKTRERLRAASVHLKERARAFSGVLRAPGDEPFDLNMLSEDEIAQLRTVLVDPKSGLPFLGGRETGEFVLGFAQATLMPAPTSGTGITAG